MGAETPAPRTKRSSPSTMTYRGRRGESMPRATALPVEERILQLLQYLGIDRAHFAGRTPADWTGLATRYPEMFCSFTLVGRGVITPDTVSSLSSRLLVFTGYQEASAECVRRVG